MHLRNRLLHCLPLLLNTLLESVEILLHLPRSHFLAFTSELSDCEELSGILVSAYHSHPLLILQS